MKPETGSLPTVTDAREFAFPFPTDTFGDMKAYRCNYRANRELYQIRKREREWWEREDAAMKTFMAYTNSESIKQANSSNKIYIPDNKGKWWMLW
jgi:hypothetical protein